MKQFYQNLGLTFLCNILFIEKYGNRNCEINNFRLYQDSLDEVRRLAVDRVLPGYRSLFSNCAQRIAELEKPHEQLLGEVR